MIHRFYVERHPNLSPDSRQVLFDAQNLLGISGLESVRIIQRYDISGLEGVPLSQVRSLLAEPPTDTIFDALPEDADLVFGIEALPGQFDQRADAAEQCLQLMGPAQRPTVRTADIYLLQGYVSPSQVEALKTHLINPVAVREVSVEAPPTTPTEPSDAQPVPVARGFVALDDSALQTFSDEQGFAMDLADLKFCQEYFRSEGRDPSQTELKVIDTYWSDHCRHTTFFTELTDVEFQDPRAEATFQDYLRVRAELGRTKPVSLMDLGTIAAKYLQAGGGLNNLDESPEINACTVKVQVDVDGQAEPWLLYFKNETHNHPTEIEPFGGAATCLGGAIRDPLSGRSYVYQAMRITGAADPRAALVDTLPGKLPQRQIVTEAAEGYSSYGNQIGVPAGLVEEIYHPGFLAKRMEMGAVVGAAPAENVRREVPASGDVIVLLGGKTGRDGCGGATGSSKSQTVESATEAGAEVQKGNPPEERKIQRLFRNPTAAKMIKRCNDFGAGGVSVAIGELADGLRIDLDSVPTKYAGLTGTELAISESQERMAVVLSASDVEDFLALAAEENLEATVVASVTADPRLVMEHRGQKIVDLSRAFLDTNGAAKQTKALVEGASELPLPHSRGENLRETLLNVATDLNVASQRGLVERFDSTAGAGAVLAPLGGSRQLTPTQVMASKLPVLGGATEATSVMSYGFNPVVSAADPYAGGYLAVVESLAKLVAAGAGLEQTYLTFQEYFPALGDDRARWGLPVAALLGALRAQLGFGVAAIGGKDSMSGTFEDLDVPPTLISVAVTMANANQLLSPEFKKVGSRLAVVRPALGDDGLPSVESLLDKWAQVTAGARSGEVVSGWALGYGGLAEGLVKMSAGNRIGVRLDETPGAEFEYGAILVETSLGSDLGEQIGETAEKYALQTADEVADLAEIEAAWTGTLEDVFPTRGSVAAEYGLASEKSLQLAKPAPDRDLTAPAFLTAKPKFVIPVFPGTNGEYEAAAGVEAAGGEADVFVVRDLSASQISGSVNELARRLSSSQGLILPSGAATGNQPGASAKFITTMLRRPEISAQITALLDEREGLILGIANGFQALIKLGLVPYGKFVEPGTTSPTLTYNQIGRHQSRLVRVRVTSASSPWLAEADMGDVYTIPFSSAEGRFVASPTQLDELLSGGQVATQYVDEAGNPTMDADFNPAGSAGAVEGLTSPDGRVLGVMSNWDRSGNGLYRNVPGVSNPGLMRAAVAYYRQ